MLLKHTSTFVTFLILPVFRAFNTKLPKRLGMSWIRYVPKHANSFDPRACWNFRGYHATPRRGFHVSVTMRCFKNLLKTSYSVRFIQSDSSWGLSWKIFPLPCWPHFHLSLTCWLHLSKLAHLRNIVKYHEIRAAHVDTYVQRILFLDIACVACFLMFLVCQILVKFIEPVKQQVSEQKESKTSLHPKKSWMILHSAYRRIKPSWNIFWEVPLATQFWMFSNVAPWSVAWLTPNHWRWPFCSRLCLKPPMQRHASSCVHSTHTKRLRYAWAHTKKKSATQTWFKMLKNYSKKINI